MNLSGIVLGIAVVVFILVRQLREQPVKEDRGYRGSLILMIIGVFEIAQYVQLKTVHVSLPAYLILGASLVIGAGFGYARSKYVHLWRDHGVLVRKGNWITILLWIVGLGLHLASDPILSHVAPSAHQLGSTSILLYIGVSLLAQRFVLMERGKLAEERFAHHTLPAE